MNGTKAADRRPRTCVLVLGMHRSGTSAVTRMINLLGASLPKEVMGASDSNPDGHWEAAALVDINDQMLYECASSWNDWRPFDPPTALGPVRLAHYRAEILRRIDEQFAGEALFVLKDPRICRFAPLYLEALATLGVAAKVVLIWRDPLEVAQSLRKRVAPNWRDAMPLNYAMRLWLRYNLEAEAATRDVERIVVSYESIVNDADAATIRLRGLVALAVPEDVTVDVDAARASVRRDLRHNARGACAAESYGTLGEWGEAACAALAALSLDGADSAAKGELDELRAKLQEDLRRNGDDITYLLAGETSVRAELADVMRQRNLIIARTRELEANERALEEMLRGRDALLESKDDLLHAKTALLETKDALLKANETSLRANEAALKANEAALAEVRGALAKQRRQLIIELASTLRPDYGEKVPAHLSPWRSLNAEKRRRKRKQREDYMTLMSSPLFDADYYLSRYADVARRGEDAILHYLTRGSSEGRWPSAAVDPGECAHFFPELSRSQGNLVLRLIELLGPETYEY